MQTLILNKYLYLIENPTGFSAITRDRLCGRWICSFKMTAVEHLKPCQFSVGNFGGGVSPSPNATINHAMVVCSFLRQIINTLSFSLALRPSSVGLLCSVCVVVTVNRIYGLEGYISCRSCEFPLSSASFDGTPVFLLLTSLLLGR